MQPLSAWHKGHTATPKPEVLQGKNKTQVPHAAAITITGLMLLYHPIRGVWWGITFQTASEPRLALLLVSDSL